MNEQPRALVVMGVSGSGKSTVGALVAARLRGVFVDADALHPPSNIEKMRHGTPLTDADRGPWLHLVGEAIKNHLAHDRDVVMACSALRRTYRDQIAAAAPVSFIHLDGPRTVLEGRLLGRVGHFMPPALLTTQLEVLEPLGADESGARFDIAMNEDEIADAIIHWMLPPGPASGAVRRKE